MGVLDRDARRPFSSPVPRTPDAMPAMHAVIGDHRDEIRVLCAALGVRRLDVFGSATTAAFDDSRSDVDSRRRLTEPPTANHPRRRRLRGYPGR